MKIHYRIKKDSSAEIVRCFGTDPEIILPDQILGRTVTSVAAYAFSEKKGMEDRDVLIFETGAERMFREEERLLAGGEIGKVVLPDTLEQIGRYVFYGCRNLRELAFSGRLAPFLSVMI